MDSQHSPACDTAPDWIESVTAPAAAPLFIGLLAASRQASARSGALATMLGRHRMELVELETLAAFEEQALDLCGRLLGLVLDADNGRDLRALVRLRRGLRLAQAFLQLRRQGPVQLVARLKSADPDLRAQLGSDWVDIDLRPRRREAAPRGRRYRLRLLAGSPRLECANG